MAVTRRSMISKYQRKCFEGMAFQTHAINSYNSVKNTDVWSRTCTNFHTHPNFVEKDLNLRFLIVISVRGLQWSSPRTRLLPAGPFTGAFILLETLCLLPRWQIIKWCNWSPRLQSTYLQANKLLSISTITSSNHCQSKVPHLSSWLSRQDNFNWVC